MEEKIWRQEGQQLWEEIALPKELDQVITASVRKGCEAEPSGRKRVSCIRRLGYGAAGIAAAFAMCFFAGCRIPNVAYAMEQLPGIGNIFRYLYDLREYDIPYARVEGEAGEEGSLAEAFDQGIRMTVQEYYCDEYGIYLSMEFFSEEPFFEEEAEQTGSMEGAMQLVGQSKLTLGKEAALEGSGDILVKGVYLDACHFVGIAREELREAGVNHAELPESFHYQIDAGHINVYKMESGLTKEIRGEWKLALKLRQNTGTVQSFAVNAIAENGYGISMVEATPYEIHVNIVPDSNTLAEAGEVPYFVLAFTAEGERLDAASSILNVVKEDHDVWRFERKEGADQVRIFLVEESKWLDEWKGYIYNDGWTEAQMMEFLSQNCMVQAEVELE